jgi:hypothetical protein
MSQDKGLSSASPAVKAQHASTSLWGGNSTYVEDLYERFLAGEELPADWRKYFASLPGATSDTAHGPVLRELEQRARQVRVAAPAPGGAGESEKQAAVSRLIQIYINRGHLIAKIDPLGLLQRSKPRLMELDYMGLSEADLDTEFYTASRVDAIPRRARKSSRCSNRYSPARSAPSLPMCRAPTSGCGCRISSWPVGPTASLRGRSRSTSCAS